MNVYNVKHTEEKECVICNKRMTDEWFTNAKGIGDIDHKHKGPEAGITFKRESLCKKCEDDLIKKLKNKSNKILNDIKKISNDNHSFYIEMKGFILGLIK